ncbi:hypothetical protein SLA2020_045790 [Shorea laevis]
MALTSALENTNARMAVTFGGKNNTKSMESEHSEDFYEPLTEHQGQRSRISKKYVVYTIFVSLNQLLLGYNVGLMSGAIIFIQEDLKITDVQQEILVGIFGFVSLLGSVVGGKTSDLIGRKWTLALAAILLQLGSTTMAVATSFQILILGRLLSGVGMGLAVMIAPMYIAEISPADARGLLTSFPEVFVNVGILLGYVSNYAFSGLSVHLNWKIMLGVGILPSLFIWFALFIIPESPRWLVMQNRVEESRSVLLKTGENEADVEERLMEIQQAAGISDDVDKYAERSVLRELLIPSTSVRRMLVVGLGIQAFQQVTGIDAVMYYSPEIFKDAGIENNSKLLAVTVAVGVSKAAFVWVSTFLTDKLGRKPLLYVCTIGMTLSLSTMGFTLALLGKGQVVIALAILCVCSYVAFFSLGLGPLCSVVTSEVFPLRLRAQASALAAVVNRLCSAFVAMSFLSLAQKVTVSGTFFIYAALSVLSVLFVHTLVPETKGKSLEHVKLLFQDQTDCHGSKMERGDSSEHLVQKVIVIGA